MGKEFFKKFLIFLAVVFLFYIVWVGFSKENAALPAGQGEKVATASFGGNLIKVFVADTPESLEKGLSGRNSLSPNEGMLFVFNKPDFYGIWMKDMLFSIDIFWLDQSGRVIFLKENALPGSFPEIFTPNSPAQFVLETSAGFAEENGIKIGSSLLF